MPPLNIHNLCFGDRGPYNFQVEAGECLGLQGASGAGKSLLLRAIADLDPRSGTMRLGELDADAMPAPLWRRKVGLLPAESGWWFDRVGEHFADFAALDAQDLAKLGFDASVQHWDLSRLSTGEKQRLAILRLLEQAPQCLLLDEPTASLDQHSTIQVEALLLRYSATHQVPLLWVSHDPAQIDRVCQRCLIMEQNGRLLGRSTGPVLASTDVGGQHDGG
jgi:ABC-type iron transport system FetAB ATPase subunit